jgi:hypothetical protein
LILKRTKLVFLYPIQSESVSPCILLCARIRGAATGDSAFFGLKESFMIETDAQRRWWFATHPEYRSSYKEEEGRERQEENDGDEEVSPEEVDAYVDEMLQYAHGPVADLLKSVKRNFGAEALATDAGLLGNAGENWWAQQHSGNPVSLKDSYDQYENVLDRIEQFGKEQDRGFRENWDLFWWRARKEGWSEEQAWRVWQQIELERATQAPLHDPWVQLGLALTGAIGAVAALRHAMAERAAAEAAGNSRLATLWHRVVGYLRGRAAFEGKTGAATSEAPVSAIGEGGTRWKVGDDPLAPTSKRVEPSWTTQHRRYWKNEAAQERAVEQWGAENVERMKQGKAPQRFNAKTGEMESRELHHTPKPRREGGKEFMEVWPDEHARIDPYRRLKKR